MGLILPGFFYWQICNSKLAARLQIGGRTSFRFTEKHIPFALQIFEQALLPNINFHQIKFYAMRLTVTCLLALFAGVFTTLSAQTVQDVVVKLAATVDPTTPKVTLTWDMPSPANIVVFRRDKGADVWFVVYQEDNSTVNALEDPFVDLGTGYEYGIQRVTNGLAAFGYVSANVQTPVVDDRGAIAVIVQESLETPLANELERLRRDLIGDGWQVIWHSVTPNATVANIKSLIVNDATNAGVNTVFLLGEIPVPYAGNIAWDGHPDHQGAWPADTYYGDLDSDQWTDSDENTANNTTQPSRTETVNVPGDGKFDNSFVPTHSELAVGRVDFSNISEATFGTTRIELYRRYLDKDHKWRTKQYTVDNKVLVDDNFGYFSGEAFAENGYRNGYALAGVNNVQTGDFFGDTDDQSFIFAYGCGGGTYTSADGVGTSDQFATSTVNAVFTQIFGSYHGDWDFNSNPFMMSALASNGGILSCGWAGRPHWFTYHLGGGETIGYAVRETQNSCENTGYFGTFGECGAHVSLLGDPTIRAQVVTPVGNVAATQNCNEINLTWSSVSQPNLVGYHVYRSTSLDGYFERMTPDPIVSTVFIDEFPESGTNFYLVKAVALEETPGGVFFNTSTGTLANLNFLPATPPNIFIPQNITLNCTTPSVVLNPCGPGQNCTLTGPGVTSGQLPYTLTQQGTYTVTVVDLTTGCTATATTNVQINSTLPADPSIEIDFVNCATQTAQISGYSNPTGVSYSWTGPGGYTSTQQHTTVTQSGTYILTVTYNGSGCASTTSITLPPFSQPDATATGGAISCGNSSVQLMGSSTFNNVTYSWTGPNGFFSDEQNPTVSAAGDYELTVTTADGCEGTATATVTLSSGGLPEANPTAAGQLSCTISQVTISANPDMAGYSFAWTGPNGFTSNLQNPTVTVSGGYTVVVTNADGCTSSASVTVGQSADSPQANPQASGSLSCLVTSVTLSANPAVGGYNFLWMGPNGFSSTAQNPMVTEPGQYSLQVTLPASGCSANYSATVVELTAPTISISIPDFNLDCTTSSITVNVSQYCNLPGVTCKLNGQVVTSTVTLNTPGSNLFEVFDNASGCLMGSDNFQVTQSTDVPSLSIAGGLNLPCSNSVTTLTASSSSVGVTFNWTGLGSNPAQTVGVGTYTVTATGTNGCETSQTVTVTSPPPLVLSISGNVACDGTFDPEVTAGGGIPPLTYTYSPTIPFPPSTNYSVLVTDANGCTIELTGTVPAIVPTEFGITITDETVLGENDGTATVTPIGGHPPFSFLWDNGQSTPTATGLSPGGHVCTITDANGCQFTVNVIVGEGVNATSDLPGLRSLKLSPNPTSGRFELNLALENPLEVRVEMLDVAGRILSKTNAERVQDKTWTFDLSSATSGIYFCKIIAGGHVAVLKVAKVD